MSTLRSAERAWARGAVRAVARAAAPAWAGAGVVAASLLGGEGVSAPALTAAALATPALGLGLALAWASVVAPAGAVVRAVAGGWMRALPVHRGALAAVQAALLLALQLPWALLWAVGRGPAAGAAAAVLGAAATAALAGLGARSSARAPRWRRAAGPARALLRLRLAGLVRGHAPAVVRGLALAWLVGALAGWVCGVNALDAEETAWWTLAVAALVLPAAVGPLATPLADGDRRLAPLLATAGCTAGQRRGSHAAAAVAVGVAVGVAAVVGAATAGVTAPRPALPLAGWLLGLGGALGALSLPAGAARAGRGAAWLGFVAAAGALAVAVLGPPAVLGLGAAAAPVLAHAPPAEAA